LSWSMVTSLFFFGLTASLKIFSFPLWLLL
jgi:hypothetical protein